jgi:hypothetical protein
MTLLEAIIAFVLLSVVGIACLDQSRGASQLQLSSAEWDRAVARGESALAAAVTGPAPDDATADTAVRVARRVWRDRVDVIEVSVPLSDGRWFSLTRLVSRPDASTGAAR